MRMPGLQAPVNLVAQPDARRRVFGVLSLFTSLGTLVCCALPSLLVLLGLGATVASFLSAAPWLVTLSRHKHWVFAASGSLIVLNCLYVYALAPSLRGAGEGCNGNAGGCRTVDRISRGVLWLSAMIYLVGLFTAYFLGPILTWAASPG